MKTRPILFFAPMVRALLAGTKTQTRRIIKPQIAEYVQATPDRHPTTRADPYLDSYCGERKTPGNPRGMSREWHWWTADNRLGPHVARCPYGVPGDRLWVRETWAPMPASLFSSGLTGRYIYRADPEVSIHTCKTDFEKWKPSIHMPRAASRVTLEITGVRAERLQEISPSDAVAEGALAEGCAAELSLPYSVATYKRLWESINGTGSWNDNPWVWVIEFRRVEQ